MILSPFFLDPSCPEKDVTFSPEKELEDAVKRRDLLHDELMRTDGVISFLNYMKEKKP